MRTEPGTFLLLLGERPSDPDLPGGLVWRLEQVRDLPTCLLRLAGCEEGHVLLEAATVSALGAASLAQLEELGKGAVLPLLASPPGLGEPCLTQDQENFVVDSLQEFRTPVTVIMEFANMLSDTSWVGPLNKRQGEYVRRIRAAATGLVQRIEDFRSSLALQRVQAPTRGDHPDLRQVFERLAARARSRELPFEFVAPPGVVQVVAQATLFERSLEALFEWAQGRAIRRGPVRLWYAGQDHGMAELCLAYPAPTPTHQDLRVLAEGTVQDGLQRKSVTKLFGVGVELARSTALAMGGELLLEPSAEGGGIFRLRLPAPVQASQPLVA